MILLMTATLVIAAVVAGVGGKEVGVMIVLFCLWAILMVVAVAIERWFVRRLGGG
jgi:hypothetical protein